MIKSTVIGLENNNDYSYLRDEIIKYTESSNYPKKLLYDKLLANKKFLSEKIKEHERLIYDADIEINKLQIKTTKINTGNYKLKESLNDI